MRGLKQTYKVCRKQTFMLAKKINVGRGGLKSSSYIYPVIKKTTHK